MGKWDKSLEAQITKEPKLHKNPAQQVDYLRNSTRVAQPSAGAILEILVLSYMRKFGVPRLYTLGHPIFEDSLWSFEEF